jgi:serine/threonine protein kinase
MRTRSEQSPMNAVTQFDELSTSQLIAIDKYCTEYEQALRKKQTISLELLLDSAANDIKEVLFKELLHSDLSYRRQRGDSVNRDDYEKRFPDYSELIDEIWINVFGPQEQSKKSISAISSGLNIPGYEIKKRLARGGMGVVYLARERALDRDVAIKMLSVDNMTNEQIERFQMEARAISALLHSNIIQIFSVGEHHGQPYLVLEYASAGTLKDRLEGNAFSKEETLRMMMTLVKTIEFVHQKGFLHRDLKPSNVLFDHDGNIKISDFGLAKDMASQTELTHTQTLVGTPAYMAPEQVDKYFGKISELSDIYSLGVLMHTLLTGVTPYDGLSAPQLLKELSSSKDVPKTYLLKHNVDKSLMAVCLRCLEKQTKHRYQSASLLFDDLKRLQAGEPISILPSYRKYISRHLKVVTLTVIMILAGGILWQNIKTPVIETEKTSLLGSKLIAQLDPDVLDTLNTSYQGDENFKLVSIIPNGVIGKNNIPLKSAQSLALFQDRYLYIADTLNNRVLMIDLTSGDITHVAGNGEANYSGDNGLARNATLNQPVDLEVDDAGNLYITDRGNHAIRVINNEGIITTLSGGIGCREPMAFSNIPGLCYPNAASIVSDKEYYIADSFNQRIRYKDFNVEMITLFENKQANALKTHNPYPRAMHYDQNTLYFIEGFHGKLLELNQDNSLSTIAEGFIEPSDMDIDSEGNIYVSDEAAYPISRVNKLSGIVEILSKERLFSQLEEYEGTQVVTSIELDSRNRLFFTNAVDNSVSVVIPHKDKPNIEMTSRRQEEKSVTSIQFPIQNLDKNGRFSFINASRKEFFSDIAYRYGLRPYLHDYVDNDADNITINENDISGHTMLLIGCMIYTVSCGIEGNTLIVAAKDDFSSLTTVTPLKIENPLSFIKNSDAMPTNFKQEVENEIKIAQGKRRLADEFFFMLDDLSLYDFQLDPKMTLFGDATLDLSGSFNLGQLMAMFVLWEKLKFSYDENSGKLIVRPWDFQK